MTEEHKPEQTDYDREFLKSYRQSASAIMILIGTTLVAILGFTGSVWSKSHGDLFEHCSQAIRYLSLLFMISIVYYIWAVMSDLYYHIRHRLIGKIFVLSAYPVSMAVMPIILLYLYIAGAFAVDVSNTLKSESIKQKIEDGAKETSEF